MKIRIILTRDEIDGASLAVGNMLDNEHDKGADDGLASSWAESCAETLGDAQPGLVVFEVYEFAAMQEACAAFVDYADDADHYGECAGRLYQRLMTAYDPLV